MSANPHREAPTTWLGAPPDRARLAVVLLHGRAQTPAIIDEIVVRRLALADVCFAAPSAAGQTWYPGSFLLPVADNEPALSHALAAVADVSDELASFGFARESQVVLGFSQGACLGSELVYRSGARFAALVALTGGLMGPPGVTRWDSTVDAWVDMPVILGGASEDPWVPMSRMRETAEVFAARGARVDARFHDGKIHEIPDDQIDRVRALLQSLIA